MISEIENNLKIKHVSNLKTNHNHVHNDLYTGFYAGKEVVIRVTRDGRKNKALLRGEVDFLRQLKGCYLNVVRPLKIGGQYVHTLEVDKQERLAVVFEKIDGYGCFDLEHTDKHIISAATNLAKIHEISMKGRSYDRPTWDMNPYFIDIKDCLKELKCHEKIYSIFLELKNRLTKHVKTAENYGLVHGDFFYANMIYHNNDVTIIDFDECEYNWYWYDIIVYFFYYLLGGDPNNIDYKENKRKYKLFIKTYKAFNSLSLEEPDFFNDLTLLRGFKLYISCKKILKNHFGQWPSDYVNLFEDSIMNNKPIFQWDQIM